MKKINESTVRINDNLIDFARVISDVIEFDNIYVIQTEAKEGETIKDSFKTNRIFGISKKEGEVLWKRPGFKISKQKRKKKMVLLKKLEEKDEYDLIIYAISMILYIDPETGNILRQEQIK